MSIALLALTEALRSIGVATVYVGDPLTVGGMVALGKTEGDITLDMSVEENALTAPEHTGGVPHQINIMAGGVSGTIPIIMGDTAIWPKIMPTGIRGMGWSNQQPVVTTAMGIVPNAEVGTSLAYNGTVYSGSPGVAPVNAVWIWKVSLRPGTMTWKFSDGGKVIMPVSFRAMFDATKPEGHKVFTIGDPVTAGITLFRL